MSQLIHEDPKRLQQFYEKIGNLLLSLLPDQWDRVVMGYFLEGEDRVPHQQILYDPEGDGDYIDLMEASWEQDDLEEIILDLGDVCAGLQQYCKTCRDDWQSMTFRMQPSGEFSVKYSYDPIDRYQTPFILNWQSEVLDEGGN